MSTPTQPRPSGGRASRQKGDRRERQVIADHKKIGVPAERVPLSGAAAGKHGGRDIDVYPFGGDRAPFCCEVKARGGGEGFKTLTRWVGDNDVLFLVADRTAPLVCLPWETWKQVLEELKRGQR